MLGRHPARFPGLTLLTSWRTGFDHWPGYGRHCDVLERYNTGARSTRQCSAPYGHVTGLSAPVRVLKQLPRCAPAMSTARATAERLCRPSAPFLYAVSRPYSRQAIVLGGPSSHQTVVDVPRNPPHLVLDGTYIVPFFLILLIFLSVLSPSSQPGEDPVTTLRAT